MFLFKNFILYLQSFQNILEEPGFKRFIFRALIFVFHIYEIKYQNKNEIKIIFRNTKKNLETPCSN